MVSMRRGRVASFVLAAVFVTAGCGVPLEESSQALPPEVIPPPIVVPTVTPTPTPSPSASPSPTETGLPTPDLTDFFFIREDGLVPLVSDVPSPAEPQAVIDGLAAGPPAETGLRSVVVDPLTGTTLVQVFTPAAGSQAPIADVTISVVPAFSSLPPAEQVLLLGQVVLSLSSAGAGTVSIVDEAGSPVAVPLPDGRLLDRPATALDYITLASGNLK